MEDINKTYYPTVQCQSHRLPIIKGCCDFSCKKKTLLCIKCLSEDNHVEHQSQIMDLPNFSQSFTKQLELVSTNNRIQCKQFLQLKDNAELFKAMHNHQQHIKKISDNIDTQKVAIAQDLTALCEQIMIECQKVKDQLYQKLDQFNTNYVEAFRCFQKSFQSSFSLASDYYYSHTSQFNNKLAQQNEKANEFLGSLKSSSTQQSKSLDDLKQITSFVGNVPSSSPLYNQTPEIQVLTSLCSETIKQFLLNKLKTPLAIANMSPLKRQQSDQKEQEQKMLQSNQIQKLKSFQQPSGLNSPMQINSPTGIKGSNNFITAGGQIARIGENFGMNPFLTLRPFKKYQLDFPVTCILALSQSLFALASANDGKIHMFYREQKKATLFDAHETQISILEKLDINRNDIFAFLSTGQDGTIMVWQTNSSNNIEKIRKYQFGIKPIQCAMDFQNGGGFVFVDHDGRIGYINPFTNEESISLKSKVVGRPVRITLNKPNEQFITYIIGQDSGMLWKIIDVDGKKEFQSQLGQTLPSCPCIVSLPQFPGQCALVSTIGVTVIDLDQKLLDRDARVGPEVETLSFEFAQENLMFLIVIPFGYGLPQQFKIEKRPGQIPKYDVKAQELKLEVISNLEMSGKPKIRIFKEDEKIFIILSNTKQQELLMYEVLRR